jgi:microsomal dipeptidase-like Zn-dependent dipeptidase
MTRLLKFTGVALFIVLSFAPLVVPDLVEQSMNEVLPHTPYTISPAAQELHDSLFVADLHSDSLLWMRDLSRRSDIGHMDLPRLREGNVALQVFSATTKSPPDLNYERNEADADDITLLAVVSLWPVRTWGSLYERAVFQLEKLRRLEARSELTLVTTREELAEVTARRESGEPAIAALYLIEGAHPLEGDIRKLDRLFDKGLRIAGLTHFFDNELGGSLHGTSSAGLSEFGRAVVRRANELGVIIDVAHASPAMVEEVLELSTRPVMLSHGGLKGNCDSARNLDDALMRRIAAAGGIIGIGFWDAAICDPSPQGVVAAIRYAIDLLGVEHVALGSDYDGTIAVTFDTSELAILTQTMLQSGFPEAEIRAVMGGNVRRFLLDNLPEG